MARPATIVALVLIVVTLFFFLARRSSDHTDSSFTRTGSRAKTTLVAKQTPTGANNGPPSKSGTRPLRSRSKPLPPASALLPHAPPYGSGPRPGPTDMVHVHYHGTTLDGEVFDSSIDRGKPISFTLNHVIKGWTEGLQLMQVGAKYKFTIPPDLAYGDSGVGDKIGPGETLVCEGELLELPPNP